MHRYLKIPIKPVFFLTYLLLFLLTPQVWKDRDSLFWPTLRMLVQFLPANQDRQIPHTVVYQFSVQHGLASCHADCERCKIPGVGYCFKAPAQTRGLAHHVSSLLLLRATSHGKGVTSFTMACRHLLYPNRHSSVLKMQSQSPRSSGKSQCDSRE